MRDVLAQRSGVCQDFAHVMIGFRRSLRIPALYVSGYGQWIIQRQPGFRRRKISSKTQ